MLDNWATSFGMWERAKQSLGGGVSSGLRLAMKPHPLYFDRANGSKMWDVDGHVYTDYVLGWGPVILGHCDPDVTSAVQRQVQTAVTFGAQHPLEYLVAEKVLSHLKFAERLLYSNTGSEAVQIAIRLARAVTGRYKILKFIGHYHGWSDQILVSYRPSPHNSSVHGESTGQSSKAYEDVLVVHWNDISEVERIFQEHASELAAVIAEPVLGNSGVIEPIDGFLGRLRELASRYGAVLIFDEVITGYRIGISGASQRYGVSPDLVTLGKAIANGFPLSVVAGRAEIVDQVYKQGVVHAGSFNGNPVVLAACLATLNKLEQPHVFTSIDDRTRQLQTGLREIFRRNRIPATVNAVTGMVQLLPGVESSVDYRDYAKVNWEMYNELTVLLLSEGQFVMPGGRLYVSLSHTVEDISETLQAFERSVSKIANKT
ncbi:aspartate aminotransferase family protein [Alicyclobacillus tolerans]|uniref:aspartate aminotransferase family protein n=1 Tax=Alicyclobacillus tolerans TaxID=90970 RepID=UPI001F257C80|nr:aspartate aminotransferase family protein [Alicyclobacillus tolerans]MCF8567321.1 aspartate aminotransferase family protein [Alicyclobacillus tolerans]